MIKSLEKPLNMHQALSLYKLASKCEGSISLQTENHTKVSASKLPSMVSFLLTQSSQHKINLILENIQDEETLSEIQAICTENEEQTSSSLTMQLH